MSNDFDPQTNEEPLLGAAPALGDETWDGMLDEAFIAPPGLADHLVDSFDEHAPSEHQLEGDEIDLDDAEAHAFDAAVFGGDGVAAEGTTGDDAPDEIDEAALDEASLEPADGSDAAPAATDADAPAGDVDGSDPVADLLDELHELDLDAAPAPAGADDALDDLGGDIDADADFGESEPHPDLFG